MSKKHKKPRRRSSGQSGSVSTLSLPQISPDEAREAMTSCADMVASLTPVAAELLRGEGPDDPRKWSQPELRGFAGRLKASGEYREADMVLRYADARLAWSAAINAHRALSGLGGAPSSVYREPPQQAARPTSIGWAGTDCTPANPPAWHSVVPPWIDGFEPPY